MWTGALALTAAGLLAAVPATAANHQPSPSAPVFVQTDNPAGNTVVAYHRAKDGTLSKAGSYATGGRGGVLDGSAVDHTASQGSLAYDAAHQLLYAVNAGSDTITVYAVHGDGLTRRQVVHSGGEFPVSIAVHGHQVFVLNALGGGSVQGFLSVAGELLPIPEWHRGLGLDPAATPQFTHTPGQVAFTPDGSKLVVTTKANTNAVDVFPLSPLGTPSAKPVVTTLADAVPFAVAFDSSAHLLVAEAGPNAVAGFTVRHDGHLTPINTVATGQAATCWVLRVGDRAYVSNAGSGTVSEFGVAHDGSVRLLGATATDGGTVDAAGSADGRFVYVQTGATGTVDEFRVGAGGSLTAIGSVTVPGAVGGEGIAAA